MILTVNIGSKNPVKTNALRESIKEFTRTHLNVVSCDVDSGVNEQPQSLEETFEGARNRAQNCFENCAVSFGIEDGIFRIPGEKNTFMNVCVCAMYNGEEFHYGCSSAFEYPQEITDLVIGRALDISEALGSSGYTGNPEIGSAEGAIGILSEGRLVRKDYTKQAINTALIHLKNFLEIGK